MEGSVPRTDMVKTTVFTNKSKIEGYIHLVLRDSYRGRLSDHLNSGPATHFIPITDAKIYDLNGKLIKETKCIIVNKRNIESLIEEKEED